MLVKKTTHFKKKKSRGKKKGKGKGNAPMSSPASDAECFLCKEKGHWKRNCPKYLAEKKKTGASSSGILDIHAIDVFLQGPKCDSWVFDTRSVANICNTMQELKKPRWLSKNEVSMRVGNGASVAVVAVGTMPLRLPSGLVLELSNCYYVPTLCKNIISGYCILQDGYSFKSENKGCSIYKNNIFYAHAPVRGGLFMLDLEGETHIHNTDAKRWKSNDLNTTYLWHCRLGHIGHKRMKKLHSAGILNSFDFESFDTCEACLMGKLVKTPFKGIVERASNLLEIIHTDICGPMSIPAHSGFLYFITFTDDLSRYGYVYLMKNKSETSEKVQRISERSR